ncbi:MAG: HAD family hydrolase [Treponema sp.]|jgi:putative hydrolase of the HAD superfamily|nr:HAD family hydrolase [Treponema sp.]
MKPELILFDLDDTLMAFDLVSEEAWDKAVDIFIQNNNINIEKNILLDKLRTTRKWYWSDPERHKAGRENIIRARREIVKLALKDFSKIEIKKLEEFADNYSQIQESLWYLFDDVEETLIKIKEKKLKLGVITNGTSEGQRGKLKRFNIEKYFDYIFIDVEIGYSKPDVKIYEYMLQKTKIKCENIIMVGDNLIWDIEPPQKLGIYTIWINSKKAVLEDFNIYPDKIIQKISNITEIIE